MNTTFRLDPCYALEITSDGTLGGINGVSCGYSKGNIGVMVHHTPLALVGDATAKTETPVQVFLRPNQARAIASALLSAVSEARS